MKLVNIGGMTFKRIKNNTIYIEGLETFWLENCRMKDTKDKRAFGRDLIGCFKLFSNLKRCHLIGM